MSDMSENEKVAREIFLKSSWSRINVCFDTAEEQKQYNDSVDALVSYVAQALDKLSREKEEEVRWWAEVHEPAAIKLATESLQAKLTTLQKERDEARAMIEESDRLLRVAGERVGFHFGSDNAEWLADEILGLRKERDEALAELRKIGEALQHLRPTHYNVEEDCWFSCPLAPDYCNDKYYDIPKEKRPCKCSYKTLFPIWEKALSSPLMKKVLSDEKDEI